MQWWSGVLSSFVGDGGQVECFVVVSACSKHPAIVQFRCLLGWLGKIYIYTYIHTYTYTNGGRQNIMITCLAFWLGNYEMPRFSREDLLLLPHSPLSCIFIVGPSDQMYCRRTISCSSCQQLHKRQISMENIILIWYTIYLLYLLHL